MNENLTTFNDPPQPSNPLLADCVTAGDIIQREGFANCRASGATIEGGCGKLTISHNLA
jgi:hypothetical protein